MAGEGFREGARWIGQRPTGDELAAWFKENVTLHEELADDHEKYVSGIVVIDQVEKVRTTVDGEISEQSRLTFTPYTTVSARLVYFRDLMEARGHRWEIVPDPGTRRDEHMPAGFFRYSVEAESGAVSKFIGCSMILRAFEKDIRAGMAGRLVLSPPAGSKVVKTLNYRNLPDENALMRAQTGAIGRALGFAGMLVLPGTGIATAEDVREALGQDSAPTPAAAVVPEVASPQTAIQGQPRPEPRDQALELVTRLQADFPEEHQEWAAWAKETKLDLTTVEGPKLRGIVRRLTKLIEKGELKARLDAKPTSDRPD